MNFQLSVKSISFYSNVVRCILFTEAADDNVLWQFMRSTSIRCVLSEADKVAVVGMGDFTLHIIAVEMVLSSVFNSVTALQTEHFH